jgi:hypothetical protein
MARPRIYDERRITTAVRIPERIHGRLREAAEERDVSVNLLVTRALDEYLERLRPVEEDISSRAIGA